MPKVKSSSVRPSKVVPTKAEKVTAADALILHAYNDNLSKNLQFRATSSSADDQADEPVQVQPDTPRLLVLRKDKVSQELTNWMRINTTSKSALFRGLSPFFVGPVLIGPDPLSPETSLFAKSVENAWQFSKVFAVHADPVTQEPTPAFWEWARKGWENPVANRFPMGRGVRPLYQLAYIDGAWVRLGYIEGRVKLYCPWYAEAVVQSEAFSRLKQLYLSQEGKLILWDHDGYDHIAKGVSLKAALLDARKPFGHSFVLIGLLTGDRFWEKA
ncbi:hypothetical protein HDU78_002776 [Chytriomyces hyalinus]|nr:hypothetical protein HDU78_002776 [Chytriomyces hyalinus]